MLFTIISYPELAIGDTHLLPVRWGVCGQDCSFTTSYLVKAPIVGQAYLETPVRLFNIAKCDGYVMVAFGLLADAGS